ncbi:MAG TPA: hypothetical protein VKX96_10810 [Chloroflexota bacterium]|nr:hypothetical protein [Chloroflexota bacterium]
MQRSDELSRDRLLASTGDIGGKVAKAAVRSTHLDVMDGGRYLAVFLYPQGHGAFSIASARDMMDVERRRYQRTREG